MGFVEGPIIVVNILVELNLCLNSSMEFRVKNKVDLKSSWLPYPQSIQNTNKINNNEMATVRGGIWKRTICTANYGVTEWLFNGSGQI